MNNEREFFRLLDKLVIASQTVQHEAVHTAESLARTDISQWEFPVKNIVLDDKDKQLYLVTMHLLTPPLDLKVLANRLKAKGRFSFASAEQLAERLGILPGSVSPFAVFNDRENKVEVILDKRLQTAETISAHPLTNTLTTTIAVNDLLRLFAHSGHQPRWCDMPLRAQQRL
jgi:Ala-tRNA(Pro) deacylase